MNFQWNNFQSSSRRTYSVTFISFAYFPLIFLLSCGFFLSFSSLRPCSRSQSPRFSSFLWLLKIAPVTLRNFMIFFDCFFSLSLSLPPLLPPPLRRFSYHFGFFFLFYLPLFALFVSFSLFPFSFRCLFLFCVWCSFKFWAFSFFLSDVFFFFFFLISRSSFFFVLREFSQKEFKWQKKNKHRRKRRDEILLRIKTA